MGTQLYISVLLIFLTLTGFTQPAERVYSRSEYINKYKGEAIKEMNRTGIPASITMSQAILESGDGNSPLAKYANNHFGIKCHDWQGPTFIQDDDSKNECFRKYKNPYQSFKDHSEFLSTRNRYAFLFNLKPTDYVAWAHGLKKAGYATNPKYPQLLIKIIEENNLEELDRQMTLASKQQQGVSQREASPKVVLSAPKHSILVNNIKSTVALRGDTPESIAKRLNLAPWQIKKYNDITDNQNFESGSTVFLQPKRRKSKQRTHIVKKGDTPWSISQKYGIKLERLCYYNSITKYSSLASGNTIKLRP